MVSNDPDRLVARVLVEDVTSGDEQRNEQRQAEPAEEKDRDDVLHFAARHKHARQNRQKSFRVDLLHVADMYTSDMDTMKGIAQ